MGRELTHKQRENTSVNLVYCLGERSGVSEEIARIFFFVSKAIFCVANGLQSSCHIKLSDCSLAFKVNHKYIFFLCPTELCFGVGTQT